MVASIRFITLMAITYTLVSACLYSCKPGEPSDLTRESIIPRPVSVTATGEYFKLRPGSDIIVRNGNNEVIQTGKYLADILQTSTGYGIDVIKTQRRAQSGSVEINMDTTLTSLGKEGYDLLIDRRIIALSSASPEGIFRGIQTIRQLLPARVEILSKQEGPWTIPTGHITDYPVFSYRGMMLDVSRHFFSAEDVKRVMEFLAYYKMNVLHLHLSDDQGWRIEIKSWPDLAIHGGSTQVSGGTGGYFTQEQYKDLVRYAGERYITVVPEIDMPGHTNAALASYAELNCNDRATDLYTGTRVGFSSLCTDKEITYKFIDDVVRELSEMTSGPYIHIGGDESHSTKKEDYIGFVNRVQDIVASHGKYVIGWDDIALSTLQPNTVAQHWSNINNSRNAVSQGAGILMSPARRAYLDMKYDSLTSPGLQWAGLIEVDKGYEWDPLTYIPGMVRENIIGIEAPLWSETVTNIDEVEYMVFPRLPGYAEIGWTPAALRNWDEYKERLGKHGPRFKAMQIDFYRSPLVPWDTVTIIKN